MLSINRSGLYYQPKGPSDEDLVLRKLIDRQYLATPFYGARKIENYFDGDCWCARGIGQDIFTQGRTLDELYENVKEAVAST